MKRWTLRICVFLLLGAIVNVAVAWGCVCRRDSHPESTVLDADQKGWWVAVAPEGMQIPHRQWRHEDLGVESISFVGYPPPPNSRDVEAAVRVQAGWPCYSLHGTWFSLEATARTDPSHVNGDRQNLYFPRTGLALYERGLLYGPIWPGFAINTLLYAAVVWLLFAAPFALRRRRRIKRSLCPACAYPVGDSEVCTECGKPVTPKAVPA
jgi:hypothetical protein